MSAKARAGISLSARSKTWHIAEYPAGRNNLFFSGGRSFRALRRRSCQLNNPKRTPTTAPHPKTAPASVGQFIPNPLDCIEMQDYVTLLRPATPLTGRSATPNLKFAINRFSFLSGTDSSSPASLSFLHLCDFMTCG
ncbi:MAG: hypothetical protein C5B50_17830 [Verrucomicrobia bacterium]|nr:MAG: hypothetical protein C5B50_17830 [Verrucomicrobiota bacterium]